MSFPPDDGYRPPKETAWVNQAVCAFANRLRTPRTEMSEQSSLIPAVENIAGSKFGDGNGEDGKHYWLTPPDLMAALQAEFGFDFDPCPFPIPDGFDGLVDPWGKSNYVNPPFGSIIHQGKKKGPTAWVRKAIAEHQQGKRVVLVYPVDKWILMLLAAGAQVRNLGDVRWCATEDGTPGKGTGRHIAAFILDPDGQEPPGQEPKTWDEIYAVQQRNGVGGG